MAEFKPGRTADHVRFEFEDPDGGLNVAEMDLDEAAALQRGETLAGFGLVEYFTLEERIAIAQADLDGIRARKAQMERRYPGIDRGSES